MCGYIPSRFSSQCRDYVDQYEDMIVDMVSQELSPELVRIGVGRPTQISQVDDSIVRHSRLYYRVD